MNTDTTIANDLVRQRAALVLQRITAAERLAKEPMPAVAVAMARDAVSLAGTLGGDAEAETFRLLRRSLEGLDDVLDRDLHEGLRRLAIVKPFVRLIATPLNVRNPALLVAGLVFVVATLSSVWFVLRPSGADIEVRASGWWLDYPDHDPANVIDGSVRTHWHGREYGPGWIELTYAIPRTVRAVRVVNAPAMNNPGSRSTHRGATQRYDVALYDGDRVVARVSGELANEEHAEGRLEVTAPRVTRVRVSVRRYRGMTPGFSEVGVE